MEQNKTKFVNLMIKSKPLQRVIADFTIQVASIADSEVAKNTDLIRQYVSIPQAIEKPYIPTMPAKSPGLMNVTEKAKENIQKI